MARGSRATPQPATDPPPAKPSGGAQPTTRRGRNTRAKLLSSARETFGRVVFTDVRITDITAHAGVASGTFYTYFDSKEEIFREVASEVLAEMSAAARRDPENTGRDVVRDLEYATRCYFECVHRNARIARSIEELQARDAGLGSVRRATLLKGVKKIERWIQRLQEQGICDPELEAWPTAFALHSLNVSVAYNHLVHRDAPEDTEMLVRATSRIWCATVGLI